MPTLLADAVTDYLGYIKHEIKLSDATYFTYQSGLRAFLRWLDQNGHPAPDLSSFTTPVLRRYLYAQSQAGKRPRTVRGLFSPLKALGVFLVAQNALAESPVAAIPMPKRDAPNRPIVSDAECEALLEACWRLRSERRVALARALLGTLIWCGVRASEALGIRLEDVSLDGKTLTVAQGKGKKRRVCYPPPEALEAYADWLAVRGKGIKTNYLFAYDPQRRIAYQGLLNLLREVKLIAGLGDRTNIQPHALRRAFATRLMNKGASIRTIQAALGHSEAVTTFGYLGMDEEPAKAAADLASLTPREASQASGAPKSAPPPTPQTQVPSRAEFLRRARQRTPSH